MRNYIAERASRIQASGIRKAFALAATVKEPINFSIGQPDFDVPEPLKEEAIKAIKAGFNNYSQTAGDALLKRKITAKLFLRLIILAPFASLSYHFLSL